MTPCPRATLKTASRLTTTPGRRGIRSTRCNTLPPSFGSMSRMAGTGVDAAEERKKGRKMLEQDYYRAYPERAPKKLDTTAASWTELYGQSTADEQLNNAQVTAIALSIGPPGGTQNEPIHDWFPYNPVRAAVRAIRRQIRELYHDPLTGAEDHMRKFPRTFRAHNLQVADNRLVVESRDATGCRGNYRQVVPTAPAAPTAHLPGLPYYAPPADDTEMADPGGLLQPVGGEAGSVAEQQRQQQGGSFRPAGEPSASSGAEPGGMFHPVSGDVPMGAEGGMLHPAAERAADTTDGPPEATDEPMPHAHAQEQPAPEAPAEVTEAPRARTFPDKSWWHVPITDANRKRPDLGTPCPDSLLVGRMGHRDASGGLIQPADDAEMVESSHDEDEVVSTHEGPFNPALYPLDKQGKEIRPGHPDYAPGGGLLQPASPAVRPSLSNCMHATPEHPWNLRSDIEEMKACMRRAMAHNESVMGETEAKKLWYYPLYLNMHALASDRWLQCGHSYNRRNFMCWECVLFTRFVQRNFSLKDNTNWVQIGWTTLEREQEDKRKRDCLPEDSWPHQVGQPHQRQLRCR